MTAVAGPAGLAGPAAAAAATGTAGSPSPAGPPAGAPDGTVGQSGEFLVDAEGRALLPHGVTLPVTQTATDDELDAWVRAGLSAVRLVVPVGADGSLPGLGEPPALDALVSAVERYTDRGFWVVVRLSPALADSVLTQPAAVAAVQSVSTALREAPRLIGFEVAVPASVDEAVLTAAVHGNDPNHLLWRELPASIDPAATVAVAGDAAYLVSWGNSTLATTRRIVAATEAAPLGWFYDLAAIGTVLAELVRPYPVAVAGTPTGYSADPDGSFTLTYRTEPPGVAGAAAATPDGMLAPGTASAVVLPATVYPDGYTTTVTGGQVTSAPGAPVLCVVAAAGVTTVSVSVSAASAAPVAGGGAADPGGAATTVTNCAAARAPAAEPGAGTTASAGPADGSPDGSTDAAPAPHEGDDLALLVLFPLIGAVAAALLLAPLVMLVRPRRQASGTPSGD